jgi:hypothetical protein
MSALRCGCAGVCARGDRRGFSSKRNHIQTDADRSRGEGSTNRLCHYFTRDRGWRSGLRVDVLVRAGRRTDKPCHLCARRTGKVQRVTRDAVRSSAWTNLSPRLPACSYSAAYTCDAMGLRSIFPIQCVSPSLVICIDDVIERSERFRNRYGDAWL